MDWATPDPFSGFAFPLLEHRSAALNECDDVCISLDPFDFLGAESGHDFGLHWVSVVLFRKIQDFSFVRFVCSIGIVVNHAAVVFLFSSRILP